MASGNWYLHGRNLRSAELRATTLTADQLRSTETNIRLRGEWYNLAFDYGLAPRQIAPGHIARTLVGGSGSFLERLTRATNEANDAHGYVILGNPDHPRHAGDMRDYVQEAVRSHIPDIRDFGFVTDAHPETYQKGRYQERGGTFDVSPDRVIVAPLRAQATPQQIANTLAVIEAQVSAHPQSSPYLTTHVAFQDRMPHALAAHGMNPAKVGRPFERPPP